MKKISAIHCLLSMAFLLLSSLNLWAQDSHAIAAMKRDYPGLMSIYGDRISAQRAHYVFVVDVSSSMLPYESTVKNNFLLFLDAVPDGDQVTLIKMSDESHTGYVGLLKCAELNPAVRSSIREVVNGFHFNRTGSPEDGSDGFTMAKTVLDAINVVGSNDLTFVYMLTDFEYWTRKNRYDKSKENWDSLRSLLPSAKMSGMCKYGIELNSGSRLRQEAIFKDELDRIFGKVEYQAVGSAALLSNWFSHVATNVMSVKLNSLLKEDWKEFEASFQTRVSLSGDEVSLNLDGIQTPLVSGANVAINTDSHFFRAGESDGSFPGKIAIGRLALTSSDKTLLPSYVKMGGQAYEASIGLQSPFADEINRLQGVCGEVAGRDGAVSLERTETGTLPDTRVWNSMLPMWAWFVILFILLVIIASFIYEFAFIKLNRSWNVLVKVTSPTPEGGISTARFSADSLKAPFTFGPAGSDLQVKGAPWAIRMFTRRHNPLTFQKSGYFLELEKGSFADVETDSMDEAVTISVGERIFLCPAGKSTVVDIKIKEKGKTNYKISLN